MTSKNPSCIDTFTSSLSPTPASSVFFGVGGESWSSPCSNSISFLCFLKLFTKSSVVAPRSLSFASPGFFYRPLSLTLFSPGLSVAAPLSILSR